VFRLLRDQWDRLLGSVLLAGGTVALIGALAAIAGSHSQADRLSFLASGVVGGVFSVTTGGALLLSAEFQDGWRRLEDGRASEPSEVTIPSSADRDAYAGTPAVTVATRG
jgi:hypothetical protein